MNPQPDPNSMNQPDTLPPALEQQLAELQARHAAHAEKMENQRLDKLDARDRHRRGVHRMRHIPILLK